MSRWTDEELRELVALWPMSTAAQIAYRLRRPRAAVCGKVQRLLREGLLEGKNAKHPDPQKRRTRARPPRTRLMLPLPQVDDSLAMQPCSILELDTTRCHWPLGPIDEVATVDQHGHWSLLSFRLPQWVSLRSGLNTRTT